MLVVFFSHGTNFICLASLLWLQPVSGSLVSCLVWFVPAMSSSVILRHPIGRNIGRVWFDPHHVQGDPIELFRLLIFQAHLTEFCVNG